MGDITSMLAASSFAESGTKLVSGITQAGAIQAQGNYQAQQERFNSQISGLQAQDAILRGEQTAKIIEKRRNLIIGEQRANMAASGIRIDSGSAADVQKSTTNEAALDVLTARNNAWREAWGFQVQSLNYAGQARMTQIASRFSANSTLLSGVMGATGSIEKGLYWGSKAGWFDSDTGKITVPTIDTSMETAS